MADLPAPLQVNGASDHFQESAFLHDLPSRRAQASFLPSASSVLSFLLLPSSSFLLLLPPFLLTSTFPGISLPSFVESGHAVLQ